MFLTKEERRKAFQRTRRTVRVLGIAVIVTGIGTMQHFSVRASSKVFFVIRIKPVFPNYGSARNGAINTSKKNLNFREKFQIFLGILYSWFRASYF